MLSGAWRPENISLVAPARVGAMNRAMCFVMRLVVGPRPLRCHTSHSAPTMAGTSKFLSKRERFSLKHFAGFLPISSNRGTFDAYSQSTAR
jgi:hypothetical protein